MTYVTFGSDMQVVVKDAGKTVTAMGVVINKNIRDPFAMFLPLAKKVATLIWCGSRAAWCVVRWICR